MSVHPGGLVEKSSLVTGAAPSTRALVGWHGSGHALSLPGPLWMDTHAVTTPEPAECDSCRLSMIVVINTAIVGLLATTVFAAVEVATHIWS